MWKKIKTAASWILLSLSLSGCSRQQDVYSNVTNEINEQSMLRQAMGNAGISASSYLNWVNSVKLYAPFIICGSIALGLILGLITQNAKAVKKRIYGVFVVTIPIITFLFVYGISAMYARFFM